MQPPATLRRSAVPASCALALAVAALLAAAEPSVAQKAQKASAFAGDSRLNRAVTMRWKKATLLQALADVTTATGVRLTPERAIVDEPVMVAATGMPAGQLLQHMSELLDYTWVRNGGTADSPNYLLYQSRTQKETEQAMIDQGKREVLAALNKELEKYRAALRLTPDQLAQRVDAADAKFGELMTSGFKDANSPKGMSSAMDSFALRSIVSPTGRVMVELLDRLSPAQWSALSNEESVVFSPQPSTGEAAFPTGMYDRLKNATPELPIPRSIFKSLGPQAEQGIAQAETMMRERWSQAGALKVTLTLSLSLASSPTGLLRVVPTAVTAGMEGDDPTNSLMSISGLTIIGVPASLTEEAEDEEARERRLAADPLLGRKAKLVLPKPKPIPGVAISISPFGTGNSIRSADLIQAIETAFGVRVISDAYNKMALLSTTVGEGEIPLYKALDALGKGNRTWDVHEGAIRVRSKTWAHDRRAEIPLRWLQRWKARSTAQGGFVLDDLAEMAATLRDDQVDNLMLAGIEVEMTNFADLMGVSGNAGVLRLYGRLLPQQRRALLAGQSIAVRQLFPYQQALLLAMQKGQNRSFMSFATAPKPSRSPAQLASSVLTIERNPPLVQVNRNGARGQALRDPAVGSAIYTFRLEFPDGQRDQYSVSVNLTGPKGPGAPPTPVEMPTEPM